MGNDGLRVRTLAARSGSDDLQTPGYALAPLLRYLPRTWVIWECAVGRGQLASELRNVGHFVVSSDVWDGRAEGTRRDFLSELPATDFDCVVTNPPYSIKRKFVERCYEIGKPWALLMPITVLGVGWAHRAFRDRGIEIILLDRRVNFTGGKGAWFAVAWYTWGLNIGTTLTYASLRGD